MHCILVFSAVEGKGLRILVCFKAGILQGTVEATVVVKPEPAAVEAALVADDEIGTIICEVSGANYGSVPLPEGFLPELRRLADVHQAVLIFDEVITGFRWCLDALTRSTDEGRGLLRARGLQRPLRLPQTVNKYNLVIRLKDVNVGS